MILPLLVEVPAGDYPIGSSADDDQAFEHEQPLHQVYLKNFWISRYPATVAEYNCFVDAGGYQTERYWETSDAQAWLAGEDPAGGPAGRLLGLRQRLLESGRPLKTWAREHDWKPETLQNWQKWTAMSEEEMRQDLRSILPQHSRQAPAWWEDPARNGYNQPVVGVT
jgi:formylglycine-generating enzyme required for sulfatase activity